MERDKESSPGLKRIAEFLGHRVVHVLGADRHAVVLAAKGLAAHAVNVEEREGVAGEGRGKPLLLAGEKA